MLVQDILGNLVLGMGAQSFPPDSDASDLMPLPSDPHVSRETSQNMLFSFFKRDNMLIHRY